MSKIFTIDKKNKITIVRGDTAIFDLTLDNYTFVEGDKVYFTVKNTVYDTLNIIQKVITEFEENKVRIMLTKEDTDIDIGMYTYDVQCSLVNGLVDTVIIPATFEVIGGVTSD